MYYGVICGRGFIIGGGGGGYYGVIWCGRIYYRGGGCIMVLFAVGDLL